MVHKNSIGILAISLFAVQDDTQLFNISFFLFVLLVEEAIAKEKKTSVLHLVTCCVFFVSGTRKFCAFSVVCRSFVRWVTVFLNYIFATARFF